MITFSGPYDFRQRVALSVDYTYTPLAADPEEIAFWLQEHAPWHCSCVNVFYHLMVQSVHHSHMFFLWQGGVDIVAIPSCYHVLHLLPGRAFQPYDL